MRDRPSQGNQSLPKQKVENDKSNWRKSEKENFNITRMKENLRPCFIALEYARPEKCGPTSY
jgi:hypothetical protein